MHTAPALTALPSPPKRRRKPSAVVRPHHRRGAQQAVAAIAAGFLPVASYAIAHIEAPSQPALYILVAAALVYSAPTLATWEQRWAHMRPLNITGPGNPCRNQLNHRLPSGVKAMSTHAPIFCLFQSYLGTAKIYHRDGHVAYTYNFGDAAICLNTRHRVEALKSLACEWIELLDSTFVAEGTHVSTVLCLFHK